MNILYGVNGTGFGHSARAKEIISNLEKRGHKVLAIVHGNSSIFLKPFFSCLEIKGIEVEFEKGEVSLRKSFQKSFDSIFSNFKSRNLLKERINSFKPDICITDMEYFTSLLSYLYRLPLISISNIYELVFQKENERFKGPMYYFTKMLVRANSIGSNYYFVLSLDKKGDISRKARFVAPVIREEVIKSRKIKNAGHILVYESRITDNLTDILKKVPERFIIYGYKKEQKDGNLIFKKDINEFVKDLAECKAIIATAGFSLISEAVYLKKPFFAIPLKKQFEQLLNAVKIKRMGFGEYSERPEKREIICFLEELNRYKRNLESFSFNHLELFDILDLTLKKFVKK